MRARQWPCFETQQRGKVPRWGRFRHCQLRLRFVSVLERLRHASHEQRADGAMLPTCYQALDVNTKE